MTNLETVSCYFDNVCDFDFRRLWEREGKQPLFAFAFLCDYDQGLVIIT